MKHRATTQMILCRICNKPTKYLLSRSRSRDGTLCCEDESCKQSSAALRHTNIKKSNEKKFGTRYKATCRICGSLTDYHISFQGLISCSKPDCQIASCLLKNNAISATAAKRYADGTRKKSTSTWNGIIRISAEELTLKDRLAKAGWKPQHTFLTGLKGIHVPRTFWLDFAKPDKKLCLEIDGNVHRHGNVIIKDRRRDEILREQGWQVLRITSKQVRKDPETIITLLSEWDEGVPPCESVEPQPKLCEICNNVVNDPDNRFCSAKCRYIWHSKALRGRPSPRKGIKMSGPSKCSYIPCRICGGPTTVAGTPNHPRWGKKACDDPVCQAASKLLTRQNQSKALKGNEKLITSTKDTWAKRKEPKTETTSSAPS